MLGVVCVLPYLCGSSRDRVALAHDRNLPGLDAQCHTALPCHCLQGGRVQVAARADGHDLLGAERLKLLQERICHEHAFAGTKEPHFLSRALDVDAAAAFLLQACHQGLWADAHGASPHELRPHGRRHRPPRPAEAVQLPPHGLHCALRASDSQHPARAIELQHCLAVRLDGSKALPATAAEGRKQLGFHGDIHRDEVAA
mmetsp:Transcript_82067/g.240920  ORF Transcript_82067/g.240920 Transcript_82067/m.240920 type:complete len:200 (+) Transcript_82067:465-1064(+)